MAHDGGPEKPRSLDTESLMTGERARRGNVDGFEDDNWYLVGPKAVAEVRGQLAMVHPSYFDDGDGNF